jgi:4-amino-4-deoxy-L-arabinose transferase-like glycosyltransferase
VWVLLGVIGHDPWKTQDALTFGVALDMIERGSGLTQRLADEPYLDNPPLAYWLAAGTAVALSPPLSLADAARVACAIVLALTMLLLAATATELEGANIAGRRCCCSSARSDCGSARTRCRRSSC